jgi:hypothetical protein
VLNGPIAPIAFSEVGQCGAGDVQGSLFRKHDEWRQRPLSAQDAWQGSRHP